MQTPSPQSLSVWRLGKVAFVGLGNATLIGLILLVFADVLLRNLINMPIPGVMEVSEHWLMVPMVFVGIWWAGHSNEHVRVTMVTEKLGAKASLVAEIIVGMLSAALLTLMSWYAFTVAWSSYIDGEYAGAFEIIIWPVRFVTGLGFLSLALVVLQRVWLALRADGAAAPEQTDINEGL